MVYFDCNACGEALKKNQVEKHRFKCRGCQVLSCVDCQKEFWGDAYKEHTKCISEEEKYSGKDFKPKANANKGEQKQEAWIEQVKAAIAKCDTKPKLKALLGRIQDYPNIPRKKPKFENFVKNSMGCREAWLIAEAWTAINSEIQAQNQDKQQADQSEAKKTDQSENIESSETDMSAATGDSSAPEGAERKLSKRERKEERRKKQHHSEKKEKKGQTADEPVENGHTALDAKSKKNKKRRRDAEEVADEVMEEPSQKKKKKKHKKSEHVEEEPEANEEAEMEEEANDSLEPMRKFSWDDTIMQVVHKASGNEIALKKLVKKVLSEFHACGGDGKTYTEDKLRSKLHKKVFKNPQLKLSKEKIKLVV